MTIKNPTQFLTAAAAFPAKLEEKLPEGAPKISTMLTDTAAKLPALPDLPMEIPDLPAPPEMPATPGNGGAGLALPKIISSAGVTRVQAKKEIIQSPATGVLPEVTQRRGY